MVRSLSVVVALVALPAMASAQVAARDITRGTVLSSKDIAETDSTVSDVVPGWVARRKISAGEVLRAPAVAPPELVRAGKVVQFRVTRNDVSLLLKATAISSGRLGDTVLVRLDTHLRFRGIVTGAGSVVATDSTRT